MDNTIKVLNVINNKVNILQTTGINSGRRLTNISDYNDNVRWLQHRCVARTRSSATTASASTTTTGSVMEKMIVVTSLMNETATSLLLHQVNSHFVTCHSEWHCALFCRQHDYVFVSYLLKVHVFVSESCRQYVMTSSSAVAKRPRDVSCLSVVSFNSTKRRVKTFLLLVIGYRFITGCS